CDRGGLPPHDGDHASHDLVAHAVAHQGAGQRDRERKREPDHSGARRGADRHASAAGRRRREPGGTAPLVGRVRCRKNRARGALRGAGRRSKNRHRRSVTMRFRKRYSLMMLLVSRLAFAQAEPAPESYVPPSQRVLPGRSPTDPTRPENLPLWWIAV